MKMMFKFYLLSQLIALPFMIGAIGNAFGSSDTSAVTTEALVQAAPGDPIIVAATATAQELCESLKGPALNPVQDDIQQLKFITDDLFGPESDYDCFGINSP